MREGWGFVKRGHFTAEGAGSAEGSYGGEPVMGIYQPAGLVMGP